MFDKLPWCVGQCNALLQQISGQILDRKDPDIMISLNPQPVFEKRIGNGANFQ